jgi:hypothetical protein
LENVKMNPDLLRKSARWLITGVGGALIGFAAGQGWALDELINQLMSSELVIGAVAMGLSYLWLFASSRVPALVKLMDLFAKDPSNPVVATVVAPTPEGKAIAQNVDTAVVAGTPAAAVQAGVR